MFQQGSVFGRRLPASQPRVPASRQSTPMMKTAGSFPSEVFFGGHMGYVRAWGHGGRSPGALAMV